MSRSQKTIGRRANLPKAGGLPGSKVPQSNRRQGKIRIPGGTIKPQDADIPTWVFNPRYPF